MAISCACVCALSLQEDESDDERVERLLGVLEESESELTEIYNALVSADQRDVVDLLRSNEQLISRPVCRTLF